MKLTIPPLIVVISTGSLMQVSAIVWPFAQFNITNSIHLILTALLGLGGACIAFFGVFEFRKANTTVDPRNPHKSQRLVDTGIYKFSRNPMYLGFLCLILCWWLLLKNFTSFIFIPIFIIYINQYQIKPEEDALNKKFGRLYSEYCKRVRRWI
ncbi:MAG: isoprenylcysteine carboxylmethyltransferase family protein [Aliiglaciecola sp.]|uniref:methyltransferase family protein n=1 Tax=Aliiglaciecola sp. TaxID=1872441 RepID=UPI0032978668